MNPPQRIALALLAVCVTNAPAVDVVELAGERNQPGDVVAVSKASVTLEQAAGRREIPVNEIDAIRFDSEPAALTQARLNLQNGGYATALESLDEIDFARGERELLKQEVAYYKAYCQAQIALSGGGDPAAAAAALIAFVKSAGDTFHYYEAIQTIGDLAAAAGRYDQAQKMYGSLAKAPFPALKVQAYVLSGEALKASGDVQGAIKRFDAAIDRAAKLPDAESELLDARLGKAECLAATGGTNQAIALVAEALASIDAEDSARTAAAYNALGRCYEAVDQPKDALLAYLHTDLLFDRDDQTHAEALSRLAELWRVVGKPDEAREARTRLKRQYSQTRWALEAG